MTRKIAPVPLLALFALPLAACGSPPGEDMGASSPDSSVTERLTELAGWSTAPTVEREDAAPPSPPPSPLPSATTVVPPLVSPVATPAADADGEVPVITVPPLTPEAERSIKGARNVLLSWARAIETKHFDQAWALHGEEDKRHVSKADFARNFTGMDKITVAIPDGTMEGAAGSSFYTVQTTITATAANGRPVRMEGPVVLRRVNDVPGATPQQLRWHVDRADLTVIAPTPAAPEEARQRAPQRPASTAPAQRTSAPVATPSGSASAEPAPAQPKTQATSQIQAQPQSQTKPQPKPTQPK